MRLFAALALASTGGRPVSGNTDAVRFPDYMPFKASGGMVIAPVPAPEMPRKRRQFGVGGGPGGGPGGGGGRPATTIDGVTSAATRGRIGLATDGQLIYGPFEAGFPAGRFCDNLGAIPGGLDTLATVAYVNAQCRGQRGYPFSVLDDCGGHANPYHYHEHMSCLYTADQQTKHSTKVGTVDMPDGRVQQYIYGKYENTDSQELPLLDACNGHFGFTPDSPDIEVYHYHVTEESPFTLGCIGPATGDSMVTVAQCRAVYSTCGGSGDPFTVESPDGRSTTAINYDLDCPCYDGAENNNENTVALPFETKVAEPKFCCMAMTASCLACSAGVSESEYCKSNPGTVGCSVSGTAAPGKSCKVEGEHQDLEVIEHCGEKIATLQCDCAGGTWMCMAIGLAACEESCEGGRVWETCGSPCGDIACFQEEPKACTTVCEARCMCPNTTPIWDEVAKECVRSDDECLIPGLPPAGCCKAMIASCLACSAGVSFSEYCESNPGAVGCPAGTEPCTDSSGNAMCRTWAAGGECVANSAWMRFNCEASCGACASADTLAPVTATPVPKTVVAPTPKTAAPAICCKAMIASCLACSSGVSESEYCESNPGTVGCPKTPVCCEALSASCLACSAGVSFSEYCESNPGAVGCPAGTKPCTDSSGNAMCPSWAARGECAANPGWMLSNCEASCGACASIDTLAPVTATPVPKTVVTPTPKTAAPAICCKAMIASCLACSAGVSESEYCGSNPGTGGCPTAAAGADPCTDSSSNAMCPTWAARGECAANPGWMLSNCEASCGVCKSVEVPTAATAAPTTTSCTESNPKCPSWARLGECTANPGWMLVNCQVSCDVCVGGGNRESLAVTQVRPSSTTSVESAFAMGMVGAVGVMCVGLFVHKKTSRAEENERLVEGAHVIF